MISSSAALQLVATVRRVGARDMIVTACAPGVGISGLGQARPFRFGRAARQLHPHQQTFAATIKSSHSGPTDRASYDIQNFPVLELARWLAASSKGAYARGQY